MTSFWDERYAIRDYVYGKLPNSYFAEQLDLLTPGKILLPAEGEGRNAVYAALNGWEVTAFDSSIEGKKKAIQLADENKVTINYLLAGYDEVMFEPQGYDVLAIIYVHIPSSHRRAIHRKLITALKPGGKLIFEAFSKEQMKYNSGGPRNLNMLYSASEISEDFNILTNTHLEETVVHLQEGPHHMGDGAVIRLTGSML